MEAMMMSGVLDHLWQSTLLALAVALVALALRKAPASVRHGLWFAASIKFLIPFAALAALGRRLAPALRLPHAAGPQAALIARVAQPFSQPALVQVPVAHGPDLQASLTQASLAQASLSQAPAPEAIIHPATAAAMVHAAPRLDLPTILLAVWLIGSAAVLLGWARRWARLRKVVRSSRPIGWPAPMPVLAAPSLIEPGLVGLWRPALLLPETLPDHLTRSEIDAILAHEICHLDRRDNLTAALHMLVEALFWFHPLVWWIGGRLIAERERACDEAVVNAGHDRAAYARSLVESCRLYLQSPLDCMAGASGSDLKSRVMAIMSASPALPLSRLKKALLLAGGAFAFATPVMAGLLVSPEGQQVVARTETLTSSLSPDLAALTSAPVRHEAAAATVALSRETRVLAAPLEVASLDAQPSALAQALAAPRVDAPPPAGASQSEVAAVAAAPAEPATSPVPSRPNLILTAFTPPPAQVKQAAAAFVQSFAGTLWNREPICIRVEGLPSQQADQVKARVTADARAAGLSVGRSECGLRYQVEIRFAADADRAVREVLDYYGHPTWPFPMDRPTGADRPIRAWYGVVWDHAGDPGPPRSSFESDPWGHKKLALAIVVVDPGRTQGMSLDTVSDYAAMLALSQPRSLDRCNVLPSITDLFAGACPGRSAPTGLTGPDAAYLKALYTGSTEIRARRNPPAVADHMAELLAGDKASG